jgi:X-Pro dipeptidyl-peptidase
MPAAVAGVDPIEVAMKKLFAAPLFRVAPAAVVVGLVGVCAGGAVYGIAHGGAQDGATAAAPAQEAEKAAPVFKDGMAQVVRAFRDEKSWIVHDLWVETEFDSDGNGTLDRVHVDVFRPGQTETEGLKVPVIYETSPYFSGVSGAGQELFWKPDHELGEAPPPRPEAPPIPFAADKRIISNSLTTTWVPRGFAVVHSESPGTGLSQGCVTVGGANEALAPKAVIDWLNGRARGFTTPDGDETVEATWCTGKVGMIGTSYNGTLPIAAATTGVEGLEAIVPVAPNTSYYHYYRANGLVRHPGGYMGEDIDVLYDFINSGDPAMREWCDCNVRDELHIARQDRITGDWNDFWATRDYALQLDKYRAATLMAHGLNDWNVMPSHTIRIHEALKKKGVPLMLYLHQGGHGGDPTREMVNRWFTRYLYGVENGVEKDARAWVVREDARRNEPTPYAAYPNPDASPVVLHLLKSGGAVGGLVTRVAGGQGTEKLVDDVTFTGAELATAASSPHRLLFATPELTKPLHLSGTARLTIRLAANADAANLSVWIVSLPWTETNDINLNVITRGWADPQNHESVSKSAPLEPGRFYDLSFELEPDDQIIPVGERIGLMVFSSDRDFTLWPDPGTELTIDLDATSLTLPVVGGGAAFEAAFAAPAGGR